METKEVFAISFEKVTEMEQLKKMLSELNFEFKALMGECPHEIVFKYNDNHPKKMPIDGNYYCPACGETVKCLNRNDRSKSVFKDSRIIPLKNLSLISSKEVLDTIRTEVYENIELYYDKDIDVETLELKMEDELKDKQRKYKKPEKVLEKVKKKFKRG